MVQRTALIMAGGTGGHVFPALATARELEKQGVEIHWIGTACGIEARIVPDAGIKLHTIDVQGLRGKGKLSLLLAPFKLVKAVYQAWKVVRHVKPSVVLGMGGFASGPGAVAAKLSGVPLVIHEQNAVAGLTNRVSARIAHQVLEAFSGAFPAAHSRAGIGNPVREDILSLPPVCERYAERSGALRLLVVGGSLGARALNTLIPDAIAELPETQRPVVRHQTGRHDLETTQNAYQHRGVTAEVTAFIDDMAQAYGWADLVICRAGALTVSELAAVGVPALLVPYPLAVDDHQTANARYLVEVGGAWLKQQAQLNTEDIKQLLTAGADRETLQAMGEKAQSVARRDAAIAVAAVCLESMK